MIAGEVGLVIDATRQASKLLLRDFFELEQLQGTISKHNLPFSQRSYAKAKQILHEKISKYFHNVVFHTVELEKINVVGKIAIIEPIHGMVNFARAMPFFANIVTILMTTQSLAQQKKFSVEKCILNFPALGEIYYTERGKGVFLEKHNTNLSGKTRLRVLPIDNTSDIILATNSNLLNICQQPFYQELRIFNATAYSVIAFITGKVDAVLLDASEPSILGLKLLIEEAGGVYIEQNNYLLAANPQLLTKIKHLVR